MNNKTESNKQNAINFYRMAYLGEPARAAELYLGDEYIQHNPMVGDGTQPFIDYFEKMAREYPGKSIEFLRAIGEDNLVALHTHQVWPGDEHYVTMDFFRFDNNGKIVEHWDAIQLVPDEASNENTMF